MTKYKKLLLYSSITFIVLIVINSIQIYNNINKYEVNNLIKRKVDLKIIMTDTKKISDSIYDNLINTKKVLDIFEQIDNANEQKKDILRRELYDLLKNNYVTFKKYGIQQLHFHLPNNDSFLRFHKPSKYGDNLTNVRESVKYVNKTKKPIYGFEEGRIFNGYRFVYPLFDDKKHHIGSVEISSSLLNFKTIFEANSDNHIDYVLTKKVIQKKLFQDQLNNYQQFPFSDKFVIQTSLAEYNKDDIHVKKRNMILHELSKNKEIMKKIDNLDEFYAFKIKDFNLYTLDFIPLLNDFTSKKIGYIIIFNKSHYFKYMLDSYFINLLIILLLSSLVGYIFYKKELHREVTEKKSLEYKAILNIYENMVLIVRDCKIITMNNKFLDFYKSNVESGDLNINQVIDYIDGPICKKNNVIFQDLLTNNQKNIEVSITSMDKKTRFFNLYIHDLASDRKKYIIELIDITEHKIVTDDLKGKALTDKLTNIYNRYYFESEISKRFDEMQLQKSELSLIMFDIDYFKLINDNYGHNIGDEALVFLSNLITSNIREYDLFCRWGGEEFMILTQNSLDKTVKIAEHLRHLIDTKTQEDEKTPHFTCSFGVVSLKNVSTTKEGIEKVDRLLYASKANGRNMVSH